MSSVRMQKNIVLPVICGVSIGFSLAYIVLSTANTSRPSLYARFVNGTAVNFG